MGTVRKIIFVIALIVLLISGYKLGSYFWNAHKEESEFEKLQMKGGHDLVALHKANPDCYGWIQVKGTRINYPVMWTPKEPEFYIRRNFKKQPTIAGVPFMDANSKLGVTKNYMIYGHHIKAGTMFGDLEKFEDKDFWKKHKTFTFDEYRKGKQITGKYKIMAAFHTKIYPEKSKAFKYYNYAGITTNSDYDKYVKGIKSISEYDTGILPKNREQLVTLSTCAYHTDDGRFVIVGTKIK